MRMKMRSRQWIAAWFCLASQTLAQTMTEDGAFEFNLGGQTYQHTPGTPEEDSLSIRTFCESHEALPEDICTSTLESLVSMLDSVHFSKDQQSQSDDASANVEGSLPAATSASAKAATEEDPYGAAVAGEEEADIDDVAMAFEVVVSAEGTRVRFSHTPGADPQAEVAAFCAAHVGDGDSEACETNLLSALSEGQAKKMADRLANEARRAAWKDPDSIFNYVPASEGPDAVGVELEVTMEGGASTGGEKTVKLAHVAGSDPFQEAALFCATHASSADPAACTNQLVSALEDRLKALKAHEEGGGTAATAAAATAAGGNKVSPLVVMLGTKLRAPPGQASEHGQLVSTADALKGAQVVGLYFAADWCPPCRQFTPLLAKYHARVKGFRKQGFEVVWCSASRDVSGFEGYFKGMPWPAMPFEKRGEFEALRAKYGVTSFPTFIFVDAVTGAVVKQDARSVVMQDPSGDGFPYTPPIQVLGKFLKGLYTALVPRHLRDAAVAKAKPLLARVAPGLVRA